MNTYLNQLSIPYSDYLSQYDWDIWGTLTTPFTMSLAAAERAMIRFENNIKKELPHNRVFWVAERFEGKGYHIHFLGKFNSNAKTYTQKSIIIAKCWELAVAAHRRPCNKLKKYKQNEKAISYILKNMRGKIGYGFLGELW